mmetsp:Transcript_23506/g.56617  ORF Transcript_23506/g.56617 Transcript_23506/m.56617 type:complete len:89 (+) Transcript_23506:971-1237(+)
MISRGQRGVSRELAKNFFARQRPSSTNAKQIKRIFRCQWTAQKNGKLCRRVDSHFCRNRFEGMPLCELIVQPARLQTQDANGRSTALL